MLDEIAATVETPEIIPEPTPEPTPEQQELAALKEENARLKAAPPAIAAATPQPVTSATLESYSDEQWATIEAKTGKDKAAVIRDFKDYELTNRQNNIDAKNNTTEALQDAIEANPKLIKLRGAIKEFMDEVPVADKLDPVKLKRNMEKAIIFAKGKHITMTPETPTSVKPGGNKAPSPTIGGDDDGSDELLEGEVKDDNYTNETGLRIKTGKIDKAVWKNIRHKTKDPNSVCIPADFDKPPVFK